jgi:spermidine/putrescine-binding protein
VYRGWPKRRRVLLSAATTSRTIASAMNNGHAPSAQTKANLESISDALGILNTSGYGRLAKEDSSALDNALADGTQAVRRIRSTTLWPRRTAQALRSFVGF